MPDFMCYVRGYHVFCMKGGKWSLLMSTVCCYLYRKPRRISKFEEGLKDHSKVLLEEALRVKQLLQPSLGGQRTCRLRLIHQSLHNLLQ